MTEWSLRTRQAHALHQETTEAWHLQTHWEDWPHVAGLDPSPPYFALFLLIPLNEVGQPLHLRNSRNHWLTVTLTDLGPRTVPLTRPAMSRPLIHSLRGQQPRPLTSAQRRPHESPPPGQGLMTGFHRGALTTKLANCPHARRAATNTASQRECSRVSQDGRHQPLTSAICSASLS